MTANDQPQPQAFETITGAMPPASCPASPSPPSTNAISLHSSAIHPSPPPPPPLPSEEPSHQVVGSCRRCKCKKSLCLKLYCECFAAKEFCSGCSCAGCLNTAANEAEVVAARAYIERRNPGAFQSKIVTSDTGQHDVNITASACHKTGCHCKRSFCLKRYCECYQAGVKCTSACKCDGCKNCDPNPDSKPKDTFLVQQNSKHNPEQQLGLDTSSPARDKSEDKKLPKPNEFHPGASISNQSHHASHISNAVPEQPSWQLDALNVSPGAVAGSALSTGSVVDERFLGESPVGVLSSEGEAKDTAKDQQAPPPNAFVLALRKLAAVTAPEVDSAAESASEGVSPRSQSPMLSQVAGATCFRSPASAHSMDAAQGMESSSLDHTPFLGIDNTPLVGIEEAPVHCFRLSASEFGVPPPPLEPYPFDEANQTAVKQQLAGGCRNCNCKKSKCLKLYCECFLAQVYCSGCRCMDCMNTADNAKGVERARTLILSRDPQAFGPKVQKGSLTHKKGCHCKRSFCLKNYCECFQSGVACTDACKCEGCKNGKCNSAPPPSSPSNMGLQQSTPAMPASGSMLEAAVLEGDATHQSSPLASVATAPVSSATVLTTPSKKITGTIADTALDFNRPSSPQCTPARGRGPQGSPRHRADVAGATTSRTQSALPPASVGAFLSPPPRTAHLMAPMTTPSPTRGLNVLAECSFELGPALCTPMTERESQQVCKQTNYHGVTFHKKKGKYLTRLSLPGGKHTHLGYHDEAKAAAQAYDAVAFHIKGHSATFNFITPTADEKPSDLHELKHKIGIPAAPAEDAVLDPFELIGRRVECLAPGGTWSPAVVVAFNQEHSTYTVLHHNGHEESLPVPSPSVRVLPKASSDKAKKRALACVNNTDSTTRCYAKAKKACNHAVCDLAEKVITVANRLPSSAVVDQCAERWRSFKESLVDTDNLLHVADGLNWLQTQTLVLTSAWLRNHQPDWAAQCKRLASGRRGARGGEAKLGELLQRFTRAVNWELVERMWMAEDSGGVHCGQQLLRKFQCDGSLPGQAPSQLPAGPTKRKRTPRSGSAADEAHASALRGLAGVSVGGRQLVTCQPAEQCFPMVDENETQPMLDVLPDDAKRKASHHRGVSWHKNRNQWLARIYQQGGKYVHLGYFAEENSAARAYDNAVKKLMGETGILKLNNSQVCETDVCATSSMTGGKNSQRSDRNRRALSELRGNTSNTF